jgi:hypothetical protein
MATMTMKKMMMEAVVAVVAVAEGSRDGRLIFWKGEFRIMISHWQG